MAERTSFQTRKSADGGLCAVVCWSCAVRLCMCVSVYLCVCMRVQPLSPLYVRSPFIESVSLILRAKREHAKPDSLH